MMNGTASMLGNFTANLNGTSKLTRGREVSLHFSIAFGSLIGAVTTIGIAANMMVVLAVLSDRKMRKSPMNLLLLNLAVADLLYLLAFTPFWFSMSVYGDGGWHFADELCPIARFLGNVFLVISILTYLAICVERYVAIVHPMQASVWCTRSRISVIALGIWTFAMAYQFPYLVLFQTFTLPNNPQLRVCRNPLAGKSTLWRAYKWSEFGLTYAFPILVSVLLYSRICRVLWNYSGFLQKSKPKKTANSLNYRPSGGMIKRVLETRLKETIAEVQHGNGSGGKQDSAKSKDSGRSTGSGASANLRARRSVVKMLMLCVGLFFLCYTPMVAYFLWGALFGRPLPLPFEFVLLTSALVQFQSAFNPFLYTLFATQFREKMARLLGTCRGRGRVANGEGHKASSKSTLSTSSFA